MANIPKEAYSDSFSVGGVSCDPVEFVKVLDTMMFIHRGESKEHRSPFYQRPPKRAETQFEFNGHTYKHIAEHSGYMTSDELTCDGVPNTFAWEKVINQVTAAHPGLFPNQFRPVPGLNFAEYDGGMGPVSVVEENLDSLTDALRQFAALKGYSADTPIYDDQMVHEFANAAVPTMHEFVCDALNEQFPGEAAINSEGELCVHQSLLWNVDQNGTSTLFFGSAPEGMEKFAEKVQKEYEKAVENGDITPVDEPER